jgi:hypothetical protein
LIRRENRSSCLDTIRLPENLSALAIRLSLASITTPHTPPRECLFWWCLGHAGSNAFEEQRGALAVQNSRRLPEYPRPVEARHRRTPRALESHVRKSAVPGNWPVLSDSRDRLPSPGTGLRWTQTLDPPPARSGRRRDRDWKIVEKTADSESPRLRTPRAVRAAGWRLSAPEIEQTVASVAVALLSDHHAIVAAAEHSNIDQSRLSSALNCAQTLIERLQSASESDSVLRELVERVQLSATAIRLSLAIRLPEQGSPATDIISLTKDFPMQIRRRGVEMRMVLAGESGAVRFDRSLLRAVGRARRWSQQLLSGQFPSIGAIARKERIAPRYIRDLMPLAFLSPKIVKAIVEGRQPAELSIISLARRIDVPLLWTAQQQVLGLGDSIRSEPTDFAEKSSTGTS